LEWLYQYEFEHTHFITNKTRSGPNNLDEGSEALSTNLDVTPKKNENESSI
jgi:hypothetical protein